MQETHDNLRNPARFEEVFTEFSDKIYRYVMVNLRSKEEAEDVTSTTFIRLWEYVSTRDGTIKNLQAFLYRIARHCLIDTVRRRKPMASIEEMQDVGREIGDPSRPFPEILGDLEIVRRGLAHLRSYDRDLIVWRFIEGIPVYEIALMLGISENAASVRIYRALRRLKTFIET
ncbi:sigma-70 family RNA polymerase sigma factor [Candidatus Uhrbacteria bacterium]|nr:sigma-70 family RNA polymerase sigma factor [Candidatus Uhrbacteria bacterium]